APGSLDVAHSLNNLGKVALKRGDLEIAQDYHMGTLEIYERLAPGSLDVADVLNGLGNVAFNRGDLETARDYHLRALEIRERLAPGSLDVAHSLNNLGYIAFNRSDLETAQDYHTHGLQIQERLAPGSLEVARSLNDLGRTFLARQHPQAALTYFQQAVEILEQQRTQISAPEARALLLAQHTTEYANLTQCYLTLQQVELAFATLERIRARSFLELLAERRLDFQAQAPADMLAQQQKLDRQRANLYDQLAQLSVTAAEEANIQVLQRDLRDVEHQQQELAAAFRKASPRYASLQYPQPLNCRQAQAALDPGTLQLSYLVGDEQTFLFALSRRGLHAVTLPIGQKVLAERVQSFRETLDLFNLESRSGRAREQGQALYELLLAPVQTDIRKAKRLLLCLDGPLHSLPFAALVTNSDEPAGYLGVQKPLHSTFSMTVYAQIRSRQDTPTAQSPSPSTRPSEREGRQTRQMVTSTLQQVGRLLALGDPLYSLAPALAVSRSGSKKRRRATASAVNAFEVHNPELAALHRRGLSLDPLPHTRAEVEAIGQLFPQNAILHLGAEATKIVVKQKSAQADILHLACHGWLDAKMPFSSGLILSQPEMLGPSAPTDDNGLLQAWEVFGLKLQADLVVLSCCESGLGQAMAGEGLVGLTRAFTYAGARSVLASLWEIHDASTAAFMTYFYTAWKEGASKDVALQQAIVQMRAHPQWKHPFYWAPFLLNGDWS
ncbi:MAG TPA: CHAT domain-containing protein, partial [Chthonomonadaceae bacterium]|nr:CHAT domain-containing protein [Chthonomonadaceae bacterium]